MSLIGDGELDQKRMEPHEVAGDEDLKARTAYEVGDVTAGNKYYGKSDPMRCINAHPTRFYLDGRHRQGITLRN